MTMKYEDNFDKIYQSIILKSKLISEDTEDEIEDDVDKDENDGWGEDVEESLTSILNKIADLQYEINNCQRGAYTSCKTKNELSQYIISLSEDLADVANEIED